MSARRSKFQDLLDQREPSVSPPTAEAPPVDTPQPLPAPAPPANVRSKALAKSKDPDYTPVTIYIRKDTYQNVQMRLLTQGRHREVSELTNELFLVWLAAQQ
ncbi:MAG: hypothetical protein SH847_26150 [Roseiflexaceae bacterium]|nr:hypothetical protein [Roseiflexaceae bacterium]